ncbi:MAG TPA: FecR domain-containing protein [Bacteroidales bacterium]|nr:FecR domain-containing protein [Bacteroidales bacterium]
MDELRQIKIDRYIKGLSSESERQEMESIFLSEETDIYFRDSLEKDFNSFLSKPPDKEMEIDRLIDKLYADPVDENKTRPRGVKKALAIYTNIAAILILPLLVGGLYLYLNKKNGFDTFRTPGSSLTTVYAPMGSRVSFNLPDGTTGMLNSGSSISYSMPFQDNRSVDLKGEAWFDVKHDEAHPFIINTPASNIKVLGTSFNLSAYPDEGYVELVLNRGKVEFLNRQNNEKVILNPAERLVLQNGKMTKTTIDTTIYNGWKEGKLIFRGDPMGEVAKRIMRWYNVDVVLADKQLESYSFRGIFKDDKLEDILAFLAMTSPIEYEIIPREILPDGTFRKEKIIISLVD